MADFYWSQSEFNEEEQGIDIQSHPTQPVIEICNMDKDIEDERVKMYEANFCRFRCRNKEQLGKIISLLIKAFNEMS